jgi:TRAP-type C4-dicarboxylate transport system permease small subunit
VNRLAHAFGRLVDALMLGAALLLLAMVALVTADVLIRNLAGGAIDWANEVTEYALYVMTVLAAPWLLRQGRHVRLDLVLTLVPGRVAWRMELCADVLGLLVCLVLTRYGAMMAWESRRIGSMTIKNLVFPEWWLLAPVPVVFALLAVEFVFRMRRLYEGDRTRRDDATSAG